MREPSDKQVAAAAVWLAGNDPLRVGQRFSCLPDAERARIFEEARKLSRGMLKAAMTIAPIEEAA